MPPRCQETGLPHAPYLHARNQMARIFSQKGASLSSRGDIARVFPWNASKVPGNGIASCLIPTRSKPDGEDFFAERCVPFSSLSLFSVECLQGARKRDCLMPHTYTLETRWRGFFRRKVRPFLIARIFSQKGASLSHPHPFLIPFSSSSLSHPFLIASLSHRVPFSSRPFLIASLSHRPFLIASLSHRVPFSSSLSHLLQ
jgi:hypothetical protein